MAIPLTRNPKFQWNKHDIVELRKEYYEIWLSDFCKKHKVWRWPVFNQLGYLPDDIKKEITARKFRKILRPNKKKLEILENTTKVARLYEKKMKDMKPVEYVWPWGLFMNKF